jgi:hypothetical protein
MTIDRGFLEIWKAKCPHAFTATPPFKPHTGFIDGQLHLMRPKGMTSWQLLLQCQFVAPINRLFSMGATVVVLAFDNYKRVPTAKQPTQRKRTKRVPTVPWDADAQLPPIIPDNYETILANRVFKARVCQFVVSNIASAVELGGGRRLIVDYDNMPLEFTAEEDEPQPRSGFTMLGESDVKFCAHLEPGKRMIIDSVDGDYCVIGMLQLENAMRRGEELPEIAIRRLYIAPPRDAKRPRNATADMQTSRQYEYLHLNKLLYKLQQFVAELQVVRLSADPTKGPRVQLLHNEMRIIAWIVGLIGCDFTEGLSGIGPKTIWAQLPRMWPQLLSAYDESQNELNVAAVANDVLLPLLHKQYQRHTSKGPGSSLQMFLDVLHATNRLSERQREKLPTTSSIACLLRNCNWTLRYWCDASSVPNAVQKQYGFVRTSTGNVQRDAEASLY